MKLAARRVPLYVPRKLRVAGGPIWRHQVYLLVESLVRECVVLFTAVLVGVYYVTSDNSGVLCVARPIRIEERVVVWSGSDARNAAAPLERPKNTIMCFLWYVCGVVMVRALAAFMRGTVVGI